MAEPIRYEFVAVDKNLTATIENIDKTLLNMDANLLKVSKSMDATFSGMTRNVKASATEVDNLAKKLASLSTSKLITFSPKNINEANAAIKELTKRRNELDRTDKNYLTTLSQINNRQATLTAQTKQAATVGLQNANAIRQTTNAYNGQIAVVSQLRNQMAGLFSIYGAQRFLQQMVKVRGEFELQAVALSAMLQDRQLADQLFGQVQELALKSPFKILELNSYLKQLKAYRIENEELVGTLKTLGDVSAGLGVDMSRLILAYGQVKAASVLRGQELRQFTEAGIPLVGQLADKFTELEGRVVSTAEVFDKISKRQVSFEMIRDIFGEMTSEGGIFFNQQQIQAETLSGQVSILADAWSKMLNELGKANEGGLKNAIGLARTLIDNYEVVLDVLKGIIATYGVYKAAIIATNVARGTEIALMTKLTKAYRTFALFAKTNPYVLIAAGITAAISALAIFARQQARINQDAVLRAQISGEVAEKLNEEKTRLELLTREYKNSAGSAEDRKNVLEKINKQYPDLLANMKAEEVNLGNLKKATQDYVAALEEKIRLQTLEDKLSQNRAERIKATAELELGEIDVDQYNEVYKRTEAQNKLLLIQIDYQKDLVAYGKEYAELRKEQAELAIEEEIKDLAETVKQEVPLSIEQWKELRDELGNPITLTSTYEEYLQGFNKFVKEADATAARLAEIEARIREILEGKDLDLDLLNWQERVNDILESNKELANIRIFEVKTPSQTGLDYIKNLAEEYGDVVDKIKLLSTVRDRDVTEERKALVERKKLLQELAGVFPINLDALISRGGGGKDAFASAKQNLSLLEKIRQTYLQLEDITKGTSLFEVGGDEFRDELEKVFGGLVDPELLESYTDQDFRKYLEKLVKVAEDSGSKTGKAWAKELRIKIAEIEEQDLIDFTKLQTDIEKALNKFSEEYQPFGTGTELSITSIISETLKAEKAAAKELNDIRKQIESASTAEQRKQLEETYSDELKFAEDVTQKRLDGIQAEKQARLDSLASTYIDEELKADAVLALFKDINNATYSDLKKIKESLDDISGITLSPEIADKLKEAGLSVDDLNKEILRLLGLNKELVKEKAFEKILGDVVELGGALSELGSAISELGGKFEELGNKARVLGDIAQFGASLASGLVSQNYVQVAATVISGIAKIITAEAREREAWRQAQEELKANLEESKKNYALWANDVVLNTRYVVDEFGRLQKTTSAFALDNPYSEAISGARAYVDAISKLTGVQYNQISDIKDDQGRIIELKEEELSLQERINQAGKIQTGNEKYGGFLGIGEKTRATYSSLAEFLGIESIDLFSDEQLNEAIASYDLLDEATQKLVDDWRDYKEAADEALDQVNDSINSLVGGAVGEFSDILVDGFVNATDAAQGLKDSTEGIVEAMLQQMLTATLLAPVFDDLQQRMYRSLGLNPDGSVNEEAILGKGGFDQDLSDDVGRWFQETDLPNVIEQSNKWLKDVQDQFKEYGLDIFEGDKTQSGLTRGIQAVTEDTANIIAAYLNTIRHEVILQSGYLTQLINLAKQSQAAQSSHLSELIKIRDNTSGMLRILEDVVAGSKTLKVA